MKGTCTAKSREKRKKGDKRRKKEEKRKMKTKKGNENRENLIKLQLNS